MSNEPPTRATLLLKIRDSGNQDAWQQFVDIYAPVLTQYAMRRGLQAQDAADVVQDVMRGIANSIGSFDYDPSQGKFRGWLHTLARNQIVNYQKKNARHRGSGDTAVQQELCNHTVASVSDDADWSDAFHKHVLQVAMQRAESEVSPANWQAFYLTAIQQLSPAEAAEQLEMKVGAVYVAKSRIVARMREVVQEISGQ